MLEQFSALVPLRKVCNIGQFVSKQSEAVQEIVLVLDELFLGYPNVSSKIRYNIPFYDYGTWICYLNPLKKREAIELVFLKGKELQEIFPFLDDKGRKMVAGIEISEIKDSVIEQVVMVWEEAIVR